MFSLKEVYNNIYKEFKNRNFSNPQIETELIITKSLGITKEYLYTFPQKIITKKQIRFISKNLSNRLKYKPLSYIFNNKEFFGLNFYINKDVLIPRQETEFVVEESLKLIKEKKLHSIADIGTGSGNIIISIIKNLNLNYKKYKFYATDVSLKSLDVARMNAKIYNLESKIKFLLTDRLEYFIKNNLKLDLVISNPPYVSKKEYANLQPEIYYEPKIALVSRSGLEFYEYFSYYGKKVLKNNGYFVLELNSNLVKEICFLFEKNKYEIINIINDYQKLPRVLVVKS